MCAIVFFIITKGRDTVITGGNPLSDPTNTGRDEVSFLLGVNLLGTDAWVKNQRLALGCKTSFQVFFSSPVFSAENEEI